MFGHGCLPCYMLFMFGPVCLPCNYTHIVNICTGDRGGVPGATEVPVRTAVPRQRQGQRKGRHDYLLPVGEVTSAHSQGSGSSPQNQGQQHALAPAAAAPAHAAPTAAAADTASVL